MKKISAARISQLIFLVLFVVMFLQTEYRGSDRLTFAVNGFFRADPLVALTTILAVKGYVALLLPGLLLLLFSLLLGRFYCGWICPLGTILDFATDRISKSSQLKWLKRGLKYWLLLILLATALLNLNLAGLFDPLAILVRTFTFFIHPLIGETTQTGWVGLYHLLGDNRDVLAPVHKLLKDYLLPFRETLYPLSFLSAMVFFAILWLERYGTRNWCRNLCPLGTLLGLAAYCSPFNRVPKRLCSDCQVCQESCRMSFDQEVHEKEECILCLECGFRCPKTRVQFCLTGLKPSPDVIFKERRVLLGSLLGGLFIAKWFRFRDPIAQARVLRPPGVRNEVEFLKKCVRCGECMKVCLQSALYPAFNQAGIEGLYTPVLFPRLGYCEYNCTLCGQVCPTRAIPELPPEQKRLEVIGKAVIDKNHCLPFARSIDCIVCEEHCPVPGKAIRSENVSVTKYDGGSVMVKMPYVVDDLCNGCGICEKVCPLEGKAGIEVFASKDRKPLQASSLQQSDVEGDPYK